MENLLRCVGDLKKGHIRKTVDVRLNEFRMLGNEGKEELFKELCFCLLTANYSAEGGMRIQKEVGDGFIDLPEKQLTLKLRELGHRFPEARAAYISEARKHMNSLEGVLKGNGIEARGWLVENVKGLGYKEASHFLRNIGFEEVAIIDFHIVDILDRHGLIERPKTLTKKRYLEIENVLKILAGKLGMNLGELDLYLWYCETGNVLK